MIGRGSGPSGHRGFVHRVLYIYRNPVVEDSPYTPTMKTIKPNSKSKSRAPKLAAKLYSKLILSRLHERQELLKLEIVPHYRRLHFRVKPIMESFF